MNLKSLKNGKVINDVYGLELGDELVIKKKDGLGEITKFEIEK